MKERIGIVCCGILKDELTTILRKHKVKVPTFYLPSAPCLNYATLSRQLPRTLERAGKVCEETLVIIGRCHPTLEEILARYPARRLSIDNCFDALLGGQAREIAKETNTFFTTPAWLRHWRHAFCRGLGWEQGDVQRNLSWYKRILLLDAGVTPYSGEQVLGLFDYTQIPVEIVSVDLSLFGDIVLRDLGIDLSLKTRL